MSSATFKGFPIEWHNVFVDSEMKGLNASIDFFFRVFNPAHMSFISEGDL
jgi:hypothetical protein